MFFFFILFLVSEAFGKTLEVDLAIIEKRGSAGEALLDDPVIPYWGARSFLNSTTGTIVNSIENQINIPVTDYGRAGASAQVRGFGSSAEDVDVQAFGISLNPPQGGGFDFATFPQFLWSDYRFQMGPSLNALNPGASAGTLSLVPWSAQALEKPGQGGRVTELYSSFEVNQISAAYRQEGVFGGVVGYNSGQSKGPSASLSSTWQNGIYQGSAHFLASDLHVVTLGPVNQPTPSAFMKSIRALPVLESQFQLGKTSLLKNTLFYDWARIDYENPDTSFFYRTSVQQWGTQNALLLDSWQLGLSSRQVKMENSVVPLQSVGNLKVSRDVFIGNFLVSPVFHGVWVSEVGLLPEGSLGGKYEWNHGREFVFSRVSMSRRIPSLLDRYMYTSTFVGNPDLKSETDWTWILGVGTQREGLEASLQTYLQKKISPRVYTGTTVTNLSDGSIGSLVGKGKIKVSAEWDINGNFSWSQSIVQASGMNGYDFPYIPNLLGSFGTTFHSHGFEWDWMVRLASSQVYDSITGERLPGYVVWNTSVKLVLTPQIYLSARIENIFDRPVEFVKYYPFGRSFSLMLVAEI